ncbi:hypothetical protein GGQ74_002770 [Desulfobaculum xiamenense]|uniref:Uncharacterized protein n=1 Tax=Desulfobaculum xiamenense TaxID=995050 RepID=A0A846QJM2_9BACT|nr:hypothetical protein [Desulfobaculum xiamenense]NJB69076.1 hypothetical protein [Desulfobaculum xiamenense]
MFKFIVIAFFLIWFMGLFLGRRHRIIRSTKQLLHLLLWACFSFIGTTAFPRQELLASNRLLHGVVIVAWIAACWWLARFVADMLERTRN